jgi:hypothetical protein
MKSRASVVLAAALVLLPALAAAQDQLPSYATARETIEGAIASFDGKYALTLDDVRGFTDSVTLHPGTTVEPDGVSLMAGEFVRITGQADGKTFAADDVDADVSDPDAAVYAYATPFYPAFVYVQPYGVSAGYPRFPGPAWLPPAPRTGAPPPAPHPPAPRPPAPRPPHLPVSPPRR